MVNFKLAIIWKMYKQKKEAFHYVQIIILTKSIIQSIILEIKQIVFKDSNIS